MSVTLALLTAHLLSDFPFQTDWMAQGKFDDAYTRLAHVCVHVPVTMLLLLPVTTNPNTAGVAAIFVGVMHFAIDTRRWVEPKENAEWFPIAVDQTLHIGSLYVVSVVVL